MLIIDHTFCTVSIFRSRDLKNLTMVTVTLVNGFVLRKTENETVDFKMNIQFGIKLKSQ